MAIGEQQQQQQTSWLNALLLTEYLLPLPISDVRSRVCLSHYEELHSRATLIDVLLLLLLAEPLFLWTSAAAAAAEIDNLCREATI